MAIWIRNLRKRSGKLVFQVRKDEKVLNKRQELIEKIKNYYNYHEDLSIRTKVDNFFKADIDLLAISLVYSDFCIVTFEAFDRHTSTGRFKIKIPNWAYELGLPVSDSLKLLRDEVRRFLDMGFFKPIDFDNLKTEKYRVVSLFEFMHLRNIEI